MTDVTLHRAREAVRDGDLEEAARLLAGLDSVAALDLLARLPAQRDEFAEADRWWARVQELDADNAAAAAGRRTVARILAGRRLARPLITAGWATAVVSTAFFLLAAGVAWVVVTAPPPAAAR